MVIENLAVAEGYCRLTLYAPMIAGMSGPGQFVMAYMPAGRKQILPRPFSLSGVNRQAGEVVLLFALRGEGTALLASAANGSSMKLLGPLGNGFPAPPAGSLLVGGGIGIAPLIYLAASTEVSLTLVHGARSADELFVLKIMDPKRPGLTLVEACEDGRRGEKGTVIDLLPRLLPAAALFACGPLEMLKAAVRLSSKHGVPAWVSLEEKMACGIGACLGCAVSTDTGNRPVCSDGPVFRAEEVFH
jgi:dihydroorotate dehydrogenase electron transfer subunit